MDSVRDGGDARERTTSWPSCSSYGPRTGSRGRRAVEELPVTSASARLVASVEYRAHRRVVANDRDPGRALPTGSRAVPTTCRSATRMSLEYQVGRGYRGREYIARRRRLCRYPECRPDYTKLRARIAVGTRPETRVRETRYLMPKAEIVRRGSNWARRALNGRETNGGAGGPLRLVRNAQRAFASGRRDPSHDERAAPCPREDDNRRGGRI